MQERVEFFEEYFESNYKFGNIFSDEQYLKASEEFDELYGPILPQDKNARILDLGCGGGQFLYYLDKKGYGNYLGIDLSFPQIEYCRKNVSERVQHIDAKVFLQDKENMYDAIVANDVLEHIPKSEMLSFVSIIQKSLKTGGVFIARVPNMSNPFAMNSRYCDFTHEIGFTGKSLYQVLWVSGFRGIQILPPRIIKVKSVRNYIRKVLVRMLHGIFRFLYYIQDFNVPENLDKNIVVVAKKDI